MSSILTTKNLNIFYDNKKVLSDINLNIQNGEIVCLMGSSGSGKSTFLSALNGFLYENGGKFEGEILFKNENIKDKNGIWLKRKIATLFQDSALFPFGVEKNLTYAIEFYEGKIKNKEKRLREILKNVNLDKEIPDLSIPVDKLSGGQKQRLCIARMLTTSPDILILDEPCSSLDINNMFIIEDLLKELSKRHTILIATHNLDQAKRLSKRIINIQNGHFVE